MRFASVLFAVTSSVLLAGCAGEPAKVVRHSNYDSDVDYAYMKKISDQAFRGGNRVIWVNPPQKKKVAAAG